MLTKPAPKAAHKSKSFFALNITDIFYLSNKKHYQYILEDEFLQ